MQCDLKLIGHLVAIRSCFGLWEMVIYLPRPVGQPARDEADEISLASVDSVQKEVSMFAKMEIRAPELLRGTYPSRALRCFGKVLKQDFSGDMSHASFQCEKIDCFWSHSWHAASWKKIMLLMVVYNGQAAMVFGNLAAFGGMLLFYFGLLPGQMRYFALDGARYLHGPWGFLFGSLVTPIVFLLWQPGSTVFFDRICIHQRDPQRKSAGILSIGGILRHSESILVMWERTYATRLWTVFELAAFMKSRGQLHNSSLGGLIIRPIMLGPTGCGLFAILVPLSFFVTSVEGSNLAQALLLRGVFLFLFLVPVTHAVRAHFRWVDLYRIQLENFRLGDAHCAFEHLDESENIVCDKDIILECVRSWFGSEQAFEDTVRSHVSLVLTHGLGSSSLPFRWFQAICMCCFWSFADLVIARLRAEEYYWALHALLHGLSSVFALGALLYVLLQFVAHRLRNRRSCDFLVSVAVAGLSQIFVFSLMAVRTLLISLFRDDLLGTLIWSIMMTSAGALAVRRWTRWTAGSRTG